jgi:hypothetical protein
MPIKCRLLPGPRWYPTSSFAVQAEGALRPTTWAGPEFDATSFGPREGRTIFADMHVVCPRADYWAWTDPCRDIP